jgi:hypothetical protein
MPSTATTHIEPKPLLYVLNNRIPIIEKGLRHAEPEYPHQHDDVGIVVSKSATGMPSETSQAMSTHQV